MNTAIEEEMEENDEEEEEEEEREEWGKKGFTAFIETPWMSAPPPLHPPHSSL